MISKLTLRDFRSYSEVVVPWDAQIVYVAGQNGAGKTTLMEAIQMALLGRCSVTDRGGKMKDLLPRSGKKDYQITVDFDPQGEKSGQVVVAMREGVGCGATRISEIPAAVLGYLGTSDAALEVCVGGSFFGLDEKTQRALLLGLAGVDTSEKAIKDALRAKVPAAAIETIDNLKIGDSPQGIDIAEKVLEELRREAKKSRDNVNAKVESLGGLNLDGIDPKAAQEAISRMRRELQELQGAIREKQAAFSAAEGRAEGVRAERAKLEAEAKERSIPANFEQAIKTAQTKTKVAREESEKAQKAVTDYEGQVKAYTSEMERLGGVNDTCAYCGQPVSAEYVAGRKAQLKDFITQNQTGAATARETFAKSRDDLLKAQKRESELLDYRDRILPRLQELDKSVAPPAPSATEQSLQEMLDAETALQHKIEVWEQDYGSKIDAAREWQAAKASQAEAVARAEALEVAVDQIRNLRKSAIGDKLTDFLAKLNKQGAFFKMDFTLDPASLLVETAGGIAYRALSESERVRIDTVFRCAIAMATGLRFVVVDRADVLDTENRKGLLQLLLASKVKALVLSKADNREGFKPSLHPRIAWYWADKTDGISHLIPFADWPAGTTLTTAEQ